MFSSEVAIGISYALMLSVSGIVAGAITAYIAFKKHYKKFVVVVLAGMVIRLVVLGFFIWLFLGPIGIHAFSFTMTFVVSYFCFLMTEILVLYIRHNKAAAERREMLTHGPTSRF